MPRKLSKFIQTGVKLMKLQSYLSFYFISISYLSFITAKRGYVASKREGQISTVVMGYILVEGAAIMPRLHSVRRVPAKSAELSCPQYITQEPQRPFSNLLF